MPNYALPLEKVFHDILSKYAMMFGEPAMESDFTYKSENTYVLSEVGFKGEYCGTMSIASTKAFCGVLASNVLGIDPGDAGKGAENECDAIKEFINLTCGHFVTEAFGRKATADLTPPSASVISRDEWEKAVKKGDLKFMIEGMPVTVFVHVDRNSGAGAK